MAREERAEGRKRSAEIGWCREVVLPGCRRVKENCCMNLRDPFEGESLRLNGVSMSPIQAHVHHRHP